MSLSVAFQMDPPDGIDIKKDSTFVLGLEAQKRGHTLFYYHPSTLTLENGQVSALCKPIEFRRKMGDHFTAGEARETNLDTFDLILMRQDFEDPLSYNAVTHILDHLKNKTLVLNDPEGVRESPEKILITHYPELTPPTRITRNTGQIQDFINQHEDIILKPLNGFGGLDIFRLRKGDDTLHDTLEMMLKRHSEPLVLQKYLPAITETGDKRLIVIEGEPLGAFTRLAKDGSVRANLAAGGIPAKAGITEHEKEICKILKPELIRRGLVFVGLDVIGDFVTEINPKSPTGLQNIYAFEGIKLEENLWDAYEKRYKGRAKAV